MHPVMPQQPFVGSRELPRINQVIHRGAQPVSPMLCGDAAQLPKRILQTLTQALKAFRIANGPRFPVRPGQNEVIDQMRKRLPVDGDAQLTTVREVELTHPTSPMSLGKDHSPRRPFRCPPVLDPPPERSHLPVRETPRIFPLQML